MRKVAIDLDLSALPELNERLSRLTAEQIAQVNVRAVNTSVATVYDMARKRMNAGINLDDAYMRRKMTVDEATGSKASATITASGSRDDMALLRRYDAKIIYAPRKARYARPTTKGLALPSGMRQSGVSVQVARGGTKVMPGAFMQPLKSGNEVGGNGLGVFLRDSRGKKHHLYGPSVYQLFRNQSEKMVDEVRAVLEGNLSAELDQAISEVF